MYLEQFGYMQFLKLSDVQFFVGVKKDLNRKLKELDRISYRTTATISCLYIDDSFSIEFPKKWEINNRYKEKLIEKLGKEIRQKKRNIQSKFLYEKLKKVEHIVYFST